jgi:hypothetical protein
VTYRHVPVETSVAAGLGEEGKQRVDPLLTVKQLPGVAIRFGDDPLSAVEADDTALSGGLAYQQRSDRIALEKRVQEVPHPALIPDNVPLNERQVPTI